ncbi:MAG TPA: outer membrane protein assembly factor BamD [Tepidisphaeraceae bacterium]|nr:outer membrane protein assembly factor BamD [Tepidisphaeraceae bacterium]
MRMWLIVCALCCLLANTARGAEDKTWQLRDGHWREMASRPHALGPAVPDPVLDYVDRLVAQHDYHNAKKVLIKWVKTHNKNSPNRDRAIFIFSNIFYQDDDRFKSFFYCDELMDEYPESKLFQAALQRQFDIAQAYMDGYKDKLLGMRIVDEGAESVQMMWRIQQRAPGSPLAQQAMLSTADYYFNDRDYDLAEDCYNTYVKNYPNSDDVPRVMLRAAFSSLAQFRGTKFDASSLIDARAQLMQIQREYPQLAADENVQTVLDQIDSAFCRKMLDTGDFYERTHEPRGAAYEYRFLAQTYPASPEAAEARRHLADMPALILADAPPPPAGGYAPATEPSASAQ